MAKWAWAALTPWLFSPPRSTPLSLHVSRSCSKLSSPPAGLKELFKSIDEDGSGTITLEEMRKALTKWEHKITDAELGNLMAIADVDGDGLIDYNEFVAATMQMSKLEKEELLQKAFSQLDK